MARGICMRCGFEYRLSQLRREWTQLLVCDGPGTNQCWEPRHPQDRVRGVPDRQAVRNPAPEPEPVFILEYLRREDGTIYATEAGPPILRE